MPPSPAVEGFVTTPEGGSWLLPVPEAEGLWLELCGGLDAEQRARDAVPVVAVLFERERQTIHLAEELASRYEEIDLLYAISEILGRTVRLEEAAQTIVREVSTVVGARRASIMVADNGTLRTVAARGFSASQLEPVPVDDSRSVAALAWRERRVVAFDPAAPPGDLPPPAPGRGYRTRAYVSVPISYAAPGGPSRCIGVLNLTDRLGTDAFGSRDVKLLTAVANQIGAAIENARLVARDLVQQRLRRELELAHDLQLRLLPSPAVLHGAAEVAARCRQADSVGGDFYTFSRLAGGRVGVMLGDVSSHGFPAALVMALVIAAAGIHAASSFSPDETLVALLESLAKELESTEMFLSVFYGVLHPSAGQLIYSSAGHQHAFRVPAAGAPERLEVTSPPLGLASAEGIGRRVVDWVPGDDLLCLWTDGLVDGRNEAGQPFGEARLLELLGSMRTDDPDAIVERVFAEAEAFTQEPTDDRTLLVMRV